MHCGDEVADKGQGPTLNFGVEKPRDAAGHFPFWR